MHTQDLFVTISVSFTVAIWCSSKQIAENVDFVSTFEGVQNAILKVMKNKIIQSSIVMSRTLIRAPHTLGIVHWLKLF